MGRHIRKLLAVLFLSALAAVVIARSQDKIAVELDPGRMKINYQPTVYFPEGFPLHADIELLSPPTAEMGRPERIRFRYTVKDFAIESGMTLEIWKHFISDAEELQVSDPGAPAYFSVETSKPGLQLESVAFPHATTFPHEARTFPYRQVAAIRVIKGRLEPGDSLVFDFGGKLGARMQHYAENLFNYRIAIRKEGRLIGFGGDVLLRIVGGPARRLKVAAPSIVALGEEFPIEVVVEDEWRSPAGNVAPRMRFRLDGPVRLADALCYDESLQHFIARRAKLDKAGIFRLRVRSEDGGLEGESNPVVVRKRPEYRVYHGDLHQHTYLADGRGVPEEVYLYGRRFGLLDFGAVSEHHIPLLVSAIQLVLAGTLEGNKAPEDHWPDMMRAAKLFNGWQGFVSLLGFEYSIPTYNGGHHNFYYQSETAKTVMELTGQMNAPIVEAVKALQQLTYPTMVIPHIGGSPPDWSHAWDEKFERLFEIASVHGVFEESFQKHLSAGMKLGANAGGDNHMSAMGNAYPGLEFAMTSARTGVFARDRSRKEIWQGLYDRRTFAVTGNQRVLVEFSVNGKIMGSEIAASDRAEVQGAIYGTAPLCRVEVVKNGVVIYSAAPALRAGPYLRVLWGDNAYQRRPFANLASGALEAPGGTLKLLRRINLDQAFETIEEKKGKIVWRTAAVSGDRDGVLLDLSNVTGRSLHFHLDDAQTMGIIDVDIPLAELKREGKFFWSHSNPSPKVRRFDFDYMMEMGVLPTFFLQCEMVDPDGPKDYTFRYLDPKSKSGDYYYLRGEQLDGNKMWSSPVWIR